MFYAKKYLCFMLKNLYAGYPGLSPIISTQSTAKMSVLT